MLFGQEHVDRYRATDGEEGHEWQGVRTLLLTTTGRRSGEERTAPLIYGEDDGNYVVVASKGGAPDDPAWMKNLREDDHAKVQVAADKFDARARTATGEERDRLWGRMAEIWPSYEDYAMKTDRQIPVVVLERR
ncbi:MAG: nitroreductase family deazaflavin-dependent oxidoreductase [Solirubrobacteraceae bacterium]